MSLNSIGIYNKQIYSILLNFENNCVGYRQLYIIDILLLRSGIIKWFDTVFSYHINNLALKLQRPCSKWVCVLFIQITLSCANLENTTAKL